MTRQSKREIERAVEKLTTNLDQTDPQRPLSEGTHQDIRTVLRWRRRVAREHGVHLGVEDLPERIFAEAWTIGERGALEIDDVQAAADRIGFKPGATA